MSEVVNLAAMDSREAQVRQCISDLRRSIKQPDAIPQSFRAWRRQSELKRQFVKTLVENA